MELKSELLWCNYINKISNGRFSGYRKALWRETFDEGHCTHCHITCGRNTGVQLALRQIIADPQKVRGPSCHFPPTSWPNDAERRHGEKQRPLAQLSS